MALAIYIEDLLNKRNIEPNRIEFKKIWNSGSIYRSVCAFANNFEDIGGGYISWVWTPTMKQILSNVSELIVKATGKSYQKKPNNYGI